MKNFLTFVSILTLVVFLSGCVQGGGGLAGLMGAGGGEKEAPVDVLAKKSSEVVPSPPVSADSEFTLTFYLENQFSSQENLGSVDEAKNTTVKLYDWGRCKSLSKSLAIDGESIFPGATKVIDWEFKTPGNDNLGQMSGECPIRYKAEYTYDASTRADVTVASPTKIQEASRTGKSIQVSPSESKGRGPIKIDIRFSSSQPFKGNSSGNTRIPFTVIVQNNGNGAITDRTVYDKERTDKTKNALSITTMEENTEVENCKYPQDSNDDGTGDTAPFIGSETPPIMCEFVVKQGLGNQPVVKTYGIKADMTYRYRLNYKETVEVKPTYTGM